MEIIIKKSVWKDEKDNFHMYEIVKIHYIRRYIYFQYIKIAIVINKFMWKFFKSTKFLFFIF